MQGYSFFYAKNVKNAFLPFCLFAFFALFTLQQQKRNGGRRPTKWRFEGHETAYHGKALTPD
jgi:hypothetical protein